MLVNDRDTIDWFQRELDKSDVALANATLCTRNGARVWILTVVKDRQLHWLRATLELGQDPFSDGTVHEVVGRVLTYFEDPNRDRPRGDADYWDAAAATRI